MPILRHPLRGVVTCAGVGRGKAAIDFEASEFRRTLDVNIMGTFLVAQAAAREMSKRSLGGSLVLVASMGGSVSLKVSIHWEEEFAGSRSLIYFEQGLDLADYESSKAAVLGLGRSLASEWGSRPGLPLIRVNTLSPGYIRTAMTSPVLDADSEKEGMWADQAMVNRISSADEYRAPTVFLLGDGSGFMTGADLKVDGGFTAW